MKYYMVEIDYFGNIYQIIQFDKCPCEHAGDSFQTGEGYFVEADTPEDAIKRAYQAHDGEYKCPEFSKCVPFPEKCPHTDQYSQFSGFGIKHLINTDAKIAEQN